jgi:Fe2+ transport system protein B
MAKQQYSPLLGSLGLVGFVILLAVCSVTHGAQSLKHLNFQARNPVNQHAPPPTQQQQQQRNQYMTQTTDTITLTSQTENEPQQVLRTTAGKIVSGLFVSIFVMFGLFECFFGYRCIRFVSPVFGFVFGFLATCFTIIQFIWHSDTGAWVAMAIGICVGGVLGVASWWFYKSVGTFVVGMLHCIGKRLWWAALFELTV